MPRRSPGGEKSFFSVATFWVQGDISGKTVGQGMNIAEDLILAGVCKAPVVYSYTALQQEGDSR